jgi:DNA-binding Xre family transcriptional regulator
MELDLSRMNGVEITHDLINKYPSKVRLKLDEIMNERGIALGDLYRLTGIRIATLSEIKNGRKNSINIVHIVAIMVALRISDIRELFDVDFDEEVKKEWKEEMESYDGEGLTHKQREILTENIRRMYGN